MINSANRHHGSIFDSFLDEEAILEETEALAIKKVIVYEVEKIMAAEQLSKTKMAQRMHTSRSAIERLLDPVNTSITLNTLIKAAHAVGKKIEVSWSSHKGQ